MGIVNREVLLVFNSSQGSPHRDENGAQTWWREGIFWNTWGKGILPAGIGSTWTLSQRWALYVIN